MGQITIQVYVTKVELDPQTKQFSILFPPHLDFAKALNLKDGELLVWEISNDTITVKKKID